MGIIQGRQIPIPQRDQANGFSDPHKVRDFLNQTLSFTNTYRLERFGIWERIRLMKQNYQWLEPDQSDDPTQTPFWKVMEVDETNWTPMPVQNEMIAPLQNEAARLQGNGSRPYIKPTEDTPDKQRAAKLARDVLIDRLDSPLVRWREVEHEGATSMVDFGTWVFRTFCDIDYTRTSKTGVLTALKCPECDFVTAGAKVPGANAGKLQADPAMQGRVNFQTLKDENNPLTPPKFRATVTQCLTCQPPAPEPAPTVDGTADPLTTPVAPAPPAPWQAPKLQPFMPDDQQARTGQDYFGRPLGEDTPLPDVAVEGVSVFDYFPENQGLEVKFNSINEHGQATIRTLDWICNHFPENGWRVQAENSASLMKWHPIAGATRHYMNGGEKDLFKNHALVREFHKEPWIEIDETTKQPKLNRGRSLIMAGDVVLMDADFMIECKDVDGNPSGELIPRVMYHVIPWEIREKEIFGMGAAELIIPQQVNVNTMLAQVQDARHRFGSPKLLAREGMDLRYAGFADTGYQSDVYYYRAEGDEKPEPFGNEQMQQEWVKEYQIALDSINRIVGTMEAETGGVPGSGQSDWSAQALMYLGEKAAERRKNRIDRIREAKRRAYKHMLQIIQEKYREDREYRLKRSSSSDRLSIKKFKGLDLQGQHDVVFDDEPAYDTRLVRQAAMKDGLQMGTIVPDTASAKRKINREIGAPLDINEDQNKQVERSIDEWSLFFDDGKDPAVSERADDHTIHFQQHMLDLMGDDADQLMDDVDWNQIELALWGWQEGFDALLAIEARLKMQPPDPQRPPSPQPDAMGQITPQAQQQAILQWQHDVQAWQEIQSLPKALELRVFKFQMKYLDDAGAFNAPLPEGVVIPPGVQGPPPQVDKVRRDAAARIIRFRAHAEAHYRISQQKAQQAAAGAAMPAAPGGAETRAGTIPGSPGETVPGSGAGTGARTASGGGMAR